jgi:hypothetical protein
MSATMAPTSLDEVRAMTETEHRAWNRDFYLPSTRVWTATAPDGTERIYIGQIESTSVYDPDLDTQFQIENYVCPPSPMGIDDLLTWINTAPHGLQIRLDGSVPDEIEVIEAYPPTELTVVRQR